MAHSSQGIVRDAKGQEQPADRQRARTAHKTKPEHSVSGEATRDPALGNAGKAPGSDRAPDDVGDAPSK